jgi:small subunit ribosomal protein S16
MPASGNNPQKAIPKKDRKKDGKDVSKTPKVEEKKAEAPKTEDAKAPKAEEKKAEAPKTEAAKAPKAEEKK